MRGTFVMAMDTGDLLNRFDAKVEVEDHSAESSAKDLAGRNDCWPRSSRACLVKI